MNWSAPIAAAVAPAEESSTTTTSTTSSSQQQQLLSHFEKQQRPHRHGVHRPLQQNVIESTTSTPVASSSEAAAAAAAAFMMPGPSDPGIEGRGRRKKKSTTTTATATSTTVAVDSAMALPSSVMTTDNQGGSEDGGGRVAAGGGVAATTSSGLGGVPGGSGVVLQTLRDPSHYEELSVIGNGAYGTVYRARDKATDEIVALKKMRFTLTEDGVPMAILREISLLKQLEKFDHPNIVRLLDICHGQRREREMSLYLVFEHVHQDLASYLEKCPPPGLAQDRIKDIIWQILCGVDFLHSHRIVHRDLKPQNLLVTRDVNVKLTDFGLARIYEFYTLLTSVVVTLWYRSPEVLMGLPYATPVDIWSCGCIFAELYLRKPIFPGQYEMDQLQKVFDIIGTPTEEDWPDRAAVKRVNFKSSPPKDWKDIVPEMDEKAQDLIMKMLCFNPNQRITANEALLHPYFTDNGYAPLSLSPSNTSSSSRSMRTSDHSSSDRSFDSSLTFSSHDESGGSSMGDMSGTSSKT